MVDEKEITIFLKKTQNKLNKTTKPQLFALFVASNIKTVFNLIGFFLHCTHRKKSELFEHISGY